MSSDRNDYQPVSGVGPDFRWGAVLFGAIIVGILLFLFWFSTWQSPWDNPPPTTVGLLR